MGIWNSIFGEEKKPESEKKSTNPFNVSLKFAPLRLSANRKNSVDLIVRVENKSPEIHLVSVDALLPKGVMLGFDDACINKATEKRVGELKSGDSVEVPVRVFANSQTNSGNYAIEVTVYSHYIGFDKVLSYVKKSSSLRVV
ncbi:hypothetical protein JXA56_01975 [Candidatus Micrarchaeota archaeon]|nr:hypothetical protein [Candidatus Micrarchaeota archaeon]